MWIVRLALRRPYTVAVFAFLALLLGALAIVRMKTDVFPPINIPVVIVIWNYPGMPAEEMERRIVNIDERAASATVDGIARIETRVTSGIALLKFYFQDDADIGTAIRSSPVSSTASRYMPPGIQPPIILRYNASNVPVAQMTVSSSTLSEQQLFDTGTTSSGSASSASRAWRRRLRTEDAPGRSWSTSIPRRWRPTGCSAGRRACASLRERVGSGRGRAHG